MLKIGTDAQTFESPGKKLGRKRYSAGVTGKKQSAFRIVPARQGAAQKMHSAAETIETKLTDLPADTIRLIDQKIVDERDRVAFAASAKLLYTYLHDAGNSAHERQLRAAHYVHRAIGTRLHSSHTLNELGHYVGVVPHSALEQFLGIVDAECKRSLAWQTKSLQSMQCHLPLSVAQRKLIASLALSRNFSADPALRAPTLSAQAPAIAHLDAPDMLQIIGQICNDARGEQQMRGLSALAARLDVIGEKLAELPGKVLAPATQRTIVEAMLSVTDRKQRTALLASTASNFRRLPGALQQKILRAAFHFTGCEIKNRPSVLMTVLPLLAHAKTEQREAFIRCVTGLSVASRRSAVSLHEQLDLKKYKKLYHALSNKLNYFTAEERTRIFTTHEHYRGTHMHIHIVAGLALGYQTLHSTEQRELFAMLARITGDRTQETQSQKLIANLLQHLSILDVAQRAALCTAVLRLEQPAVSLSLIRNLLEHARSLSQVQVAELAERAFTLPNGNARLIALGPLFRCIDILPTNLRGRVIAELHNDARPVTRVDTLTGFIRKLGKFTPAELCSIVAAATSVQEPRPRAVAVMHFARRVGSDMVDVRRALFDCACGMRDPVARAIAMSGFADTKRFFCTDDPTRAMLVEHRAYLLQLRQFLQPNAAPAALARLAPALQQLPLSDWQMVMGKMPVPDPDRKNDLAPEI